MSSSWRRAGERAAWALAVAAFALVPWSTSCSPASPSSRVPTAAESAASAWPGPAPDRTDVPPAIRALLRPWHRFDPSWAKRAAVWLRTTYRTSEYPCVPGPGGSLDMIQQDAFRVDAVLRGRVAAPEVDLDLHNSPQASLPPYFVEGRVYLLLLAPSAASSELLADPKAMFGLGTRLSRDELVAVVDLAETPLEARAARTQATRTGAAAGFRFTPERWFAMRAARTVDLGAQQRLVAFLREVVLVRGASWVDVRSYLGPPDHQRRSPGGAQRDEYLLNLPAYRDPADGTIYGQLEVSFAPDGSILGYEIEYLRWSLRPEAHTSTYLTEDELERLGLERVAKSFRR